MLVERETEIAIPYHYTINHTYHHEHLFDNRRHLSILVVCEDTTGSAAVFPKSPRRLQEQDFYRSDAFPNGDPSVTTSVL